ncbi:MAG: glycosyltransferase family 39 protein [Methanolinea sp.]|nr:glycosyltransferase family 39 protein [Methanolinea sp.]
MQAGEHKKRSKVKNGNLSVVDLNGLSPVPLKKGHLGLIATVKGVLFHSRYIQILLVLTVIAAILRFFSLGLASLWLDEALTYRFSINPFMEYWTLISAGGEPHPPLFYWLEHPILVFGHNETTLRFLPAIFGIMTVPVIYFLGSEAVDRNAGIIAAAFLAFSPFHLFYSQEARMYSLMLLFLSLAMLFFYWAWKKEQIIWWIIFGIFSALAFWTQFYSIIIVAGLYLYYFAWILKTNLDLKKLKGLGCSFALFILLSLPLLAIIWTILIDRVSVAPTWGMRGLDVFTITFKQFSGYSVPIALVFIVLFLIGMYRILLIRSDTCILFIWLTILTFAASLGLSYLMPLAPRYLIGILPIFFIGIASSYLFPAGFKHDRRIIYMYIVLAFVVSMPGLVNHYNAGYKADWRSVSTMIAQNTSPGDIVVLMPGYLTAPFDFYYNNTTDMTTEIGVSSAEELDIHFGQRRDEKVIILFTNDLTAADPSGKAVQWLKEHARYGGSYWGVHIFTIN